ncbi:MAG: HDOD domain-containing protein [Planctomycetota bacterium]
MSSLFEELKGIGRLPTPPGVVVRLLELTEREDTTVQEIANVIALDPLLSAKILRFANSPLAGVRREITSLPRAVSLLGTRGVMMTSLSFAVIGSTAIDKCLGFNTRQFGIQCVCCGVASKTLAQATSTTSGQEAMLAGLLSQLGRAVIAHGKPDEYARVLAQATHIPRDLPDLEYSMLGATYTEIGSELLQSWRLPPSVCDAIGEFHPRTGTKIRNPLAKVLHVAELAAGMICPDSKTNVAYSREFLEAAHSLLGLEPAACENLIRQIADETENLRQTLEMPAAKLRSIDEIQESLSERVAELTLALHFEKRPQGDEPRERGCQASTDALTGLANRSSFEAQLGIEIQRANRSASPLGVIMIDVDNLKTINDRFGEECGDKVLTAVADVICKNIRKVDLAARYDGDEYAIIAPVMAQDGSRAVAERLRKSIENIRIAEYGTDLQVTGSIGVAVSTLFIEPQQAEDLTQASIQCLHEAKKAGGNATDFPSTARPRSQAETTKILRANRRSPKPAKARRTPLRASIPKALNRQGANSPLQVQLPIHSRTSRLPAIPLIHGNQFTINR